MKSLFEIICENTACNVEKIFKDKYTARMQCSVYQSGNRSDNKMYIQGYKASISGIDYYAVIYKPQYIAIIEVQNNADVISFDFSGCYMATFTMNKKKYAAHIAKEGGKNIPCQIWNRLVQVEEIQDAVLFKPSEAFNIKLNGIWGVILSTGDCLAFNTTEMYNHQTYKPEDCYLPPDGITRMPPLKGKEAIIPL